MDATKLSNLIDSLPTSAEPGLVLIEIRTCLSSMTIERLHDVVPNISFNHIFTHINTNDKDQIEVCCSILDKLLSCIAPSALMENFSSELHKAMQHPLRPVSLVALSQFFRVSHELPEQLFENTETIPKLIELLGSDSLELAEYSGKVLKSLIGMDNGLNMLFSESVVHCLEQVMITSETVRFRIYQFIVDVAQTSPEALEVIDQTGMLTKLVNEIQRDDILLQLNCIELLSQLVVVEHGMRYLDQKGIVGSLETMLANAESDPLAGFLVPGLIKFFGGIARLHPKEMCDKNSTFVNVLFQSLSNNDLTLCSVAVETVGFVGRSTEGKLALEKLGNMMNNGVKQIGNLMRDSPSQFKTKALEAMTNLLKLHVEDQTTDLLTLTERWFHALGNKPFDLVLSVSKQPFLDLRCPAYSIFEALAHQPWGQREMNIHPGFSEFLLDRSTEKSKEGKDMKFEIISVLVNSPTSMDIFGQSFYDKFSEYHRQGPYYVRVQSEVAMEGS